MTDAKSNLEKTLEWLRKYRDDTACRGVVLGISGGKDSTTVAMLAKKVWGKNVVGVLMPNGEQKDIGDSLDIVRMLEIEHRVVNIGAAYTAIINAVEHSAGGTAAENVVLSCPRVTDKAKTNIPPRLRMSVLYSIAQSLDYRVIGTGNASEAYIGWTTKWGDSAYDFNPIAHLTCSEVVAVGELLAAEFGLDRKYIVKPPSDGLCGKTDEDSFGFTYAELDRYILSGRESVDKTTADKIERMHASSAHKRALPARLEKRAAD